jgi:hypothetical protein
MQTTKQTSSNTTIGSGSADFVRSPLVIGLGALLAVQLIVSLIMGLSDSDLSPEESQGPLIAFEADKVSVLRIASADEELVLEKSDDGWQIPALGGFPVSEIKIAELLEKLAGIQKRIPVATSEAAIERFKVGEEDFERRLTLETRDGAVATLFLGDSPGFRRLFVRASKEQAVYEAELALFDASEKADDWTKKTVLQMDQDQIRAITLGDLELTRGGDDTWILDGLTGGERLDQEAVKDLVRAVANLNFRGVLGIEDKPEYGQNEPTLTLKVQLGGESLYFALSELADSEDFVLKVSNRPHYFRLSQYTAEELTEVTRGKLVAKSEKAGDGAQEAALEAEPTAGSPSADELSRAAESAADAIELPANQHVATDPEPSAEKAPPAAPIPAAQPGSSEKRPE